MGENVKKFLDVPLFERCRICKGEGTITVNPGPNGTYQECQMCQGEGYAEIGMTLLEAERFRARKADPEAPDIIE